jgi:hypothetical protein
MPSTQRYQPTQREDEDALTRAIVALAGQYGCYGYRRIAAKLQEAGWQVGSSTDIGLLFPIPRMRCGAFSALGTGK